MHPASLQVAVANCTQLSAHCLQLCHRPDYEAQHQLYPRMHTLPEMTVHERCRHFLGWQQRSLKLDCLGHALRACWTLSLLTWALPHWKSGRLHELGKFPVWEGLLKLERCMARCLCCLLCKSMVQAEVGWLLQTKLLHAAPWFVI